jgi:hypothetical protein
MRIRRMRGIKTHAVGDCEEISSYLVEYGEFRVVSLTRSHLRILILKSKPNRRIRNTHVKINAGGEYGDGQKFEPSTRSFD